MKKILPILTLIGASSLLVGIDVISNRQLNINNFSTDELSSSLENIKNDTKQIKMINDKYKTILSVPTDATLVDSDNLEILNKGDQNKNNDENANESDDNVIQNDNYNEDQPLNEINNIENGILNIEENSNTQNNEKLDNSFSTLYSLNNDINDCCEEYSTLKSKLEEAIKETKNLIAKLNKGEIELTSEQKQQLSNQSIILRNLSKDLTNATNQLALTSYDFENLMNFNLNSDELSVKYLILLNDLLTNNAMLRTSLDTLNNLNNLFYSYKLNIPENGRGHLMFGYRKNNENPIIKDYYIDENGDLVDNNNNPSNEETNENKTNIDTYNNTNLSHNIDTYGNFNQNTDTFFNTALLDNEFMYGAPYGRGGFGLYGNNPYLNQYNQFQAQRQNNNTDYGVNNNYQTQNNGENQNHKRGFKLKKNVDTYRSANTPSLKTKFENMKNWFSNKKPKTKDNVENPIYRIDENN